MPEYQVRVSKDYTVFCAGHFITYEGDKCEALHGHNYRAAVTVEGELTESAYVFDFVQLKHLLRDVCDQLDHRMLLPTENQLLTLTERDRSLEVAYRDKSYVFPRDEVVLLPIPNTTAEMLAAWIGGQLEAALLERAGSVLTALEVEVEESFGQSAVWRKELSAP